MSIAFKAMELARKAHASQRRKYTGAPYTDHLAEVAGIVATITDFDTIHPEALEQESGAMTVYESWRYGNPERVYERIEAQEQARAALPKHKIEQERAYRKLKELFKEGPEDGIDNR